MYSDTQSNYKEWDILKIFDKKYSFALILLNQPLNEDNEKFLKYRWNDATVRVVVDGGVNHLKKIFNDDMLVPDIICGDFDSALPEFIQFFEEKGASIIPTPDQDATDFTKAVKLTLKYISERDLKVSSIITVVRSGERLDHVFGNLNTLYYAMEWSSIPVFLLGESALTWLLAKGSHKILVPDSMRDSNIGLVPLGEECTDVTTTGLKWNLTHSKMKFGGLVSTSNRFGEEATEVSVTTDTELIWTMGFKMDF